MDARVDGKRVMISLGDRGLFFRAFRLGPDAVILWF